MQRNDELEEIVRTVIDCGFLLHKQLGPGLLESVYEVLLEASLIDRGLQVESQVSVPITFKGITIDKAFRVDLMVEGRLPIELKSTERHSAVHLKQLLTYIRILELPLGLLINFGLGTFKEGAHRVVMRNTLAPLRLRGLA